MKSMTGYGRAKIENDTREYIVEVNKDTAIHFKKDKG